MSLPRIPAYALPPQDVEHRVGWRPDPRRSALLIHDMQTYFIDRFQREETGAEQAGGRAQIDAAVENIQALRQAAHAAGVPVYYTAQPPRQQPEDRALLTDFWGTGLTQDHEAAIIPELAPEEGDEVLDKWRYSAFMRSPFREKLLARGRDQLMITGVYAHIGCLATALDAFMMDIQPFFLRDALADFTVQEHLQAVDYAAKRCARVLDTAEVLSDWARPDAVQASALPSAPTEAEAVGGR